jgi:hypothetical protein
MEGQEPYPADIAPLFPTGTRDADGRLSAVLAKPLDAHLERLARVRDRLLAVFRVMSEGEFRRARSLPQYDVTPEWVLHHLIQHEAEHRGHIGLLRVRAEGGSPSQ